MKILLTIHTFTVQCIFVLSNRVKIKSKVTTSLAFYWGFGGEVVIGHLPFTSKVAGSSLSDNPPPPMRLEPSPHVKRIKIQRSAESRGFPPGTPVSSHRES
jgi:hypothetical protein